MNGEQQITPLGVPPEPAPTYEAPAPRKKPILLGLVAVLLIVILGIGIILFLRGRIRLPGAPMPLPKVMERIENGRAKCAGVKDQEKCLRELILDEAVSGRQAEACEKIEDAETRDGCYDAIAREMKDEQICGRISDGEARDECAGAVIYSKAKLSADISLCVKISSSRWQNSCFNYIFESRGTIDYCRTVPDREAQCIVIVASRDAVSAGEPALCRDIVSDEERSACEESALEAREAAASSRDEDNDGLTNADEDRYGTNKNNPDTDGDGFKDGDEVKAGYNPRGPGRL